jgi:drug/metabolite transporter (DMT)-like permease
MAQSLIRLMVIIAFGSFSIIAVLPLGNVARSGKAWSGSFVGKGILLVCLATIATVAFYYAMKKLVPFIDASAQAQARSLDTLNAKYADAAHRDQI